MLKKMRKHARSNFIKVVLGMIILAFVFWGISAVVRGGRVDVVATIDGEPITASAYQRELEQLRRLYRNLYRDSYSADLEKAINLQGQALEKLVDSHLLVREAQRLGLAVSDEEVAGSVMATFQVEGRYNPQHYRSVLRSQNMTPAQFEEGERKRLLMAKLESLVTDGIPVDADEIRQAFIAENEKLTARYLKLPFERFKREVKVGRDEIEAYYNATKEDLREPARVTIEYSVYLPERFAEAVPVAEEEVQKAYERRREEFTEPERFHLRRILIAVSPDAGEESRNKLREKATEVRERLVKGEDFAAVAKSASDDQATAPAGGDLGFVALADLEDKLAQAVKDIEPGGISSVVEGEKGFEILKVEEHQPEGVKPLEEVRPEIIDQLKKEGADEVALEARLQDLTGLRRGEEFRAVMGRRGIEVHKSQPVAKGEPIAGVDEADEMITRALELEAGQVDQVRSLSPPYYLIRVAEKTPSFVPALEKVTASVEATVAEKKAQAAALDFAQSALDKLRNGKSTLQDLAKQEGTELLTTKPFTISDPTAGGLGGRPDLARELFRLTKDSPVAEKPVTLTDGVAIVVLGERTVPDLSKLDEEEEKAIRRRILERRRQEAIAAFRDLLKSRSNIRINPDRIAGAAAAR